MKFEYKNIFLYLLFLVLGLVGGYILFGSNQNVTDTAEVEPASTENPDNESIWTCSMHPQIRQNEEGLCPICEMDLIPLDSGTSDDPLVLQMTESAVQLSSIQTTKIGASEKTESKKLRLSGKVQADERTASSLVTHIPGRIEQLLVNFTGEKVYKGQTIAKIYSPELISAQGELIQALKMQDVNPSLIEAARKKLEYWKIDSGLIDSIERTGKILETFPVKAARSGTVTSKRISVGDYLKKGEVLFNTIDLNRVWVLFDAYESDLKNIKKGNWIEFSTSSEPNNSFRGKISFIDPVINPDTRVANVRVEVENRNGKLKPEMLVYGLLESKSNSKATLTVPKSAVLWTGKRSVVYAKLPDLDIPSFQYREIEIGERIGDSYEVVSGLKAGEEIVTNGAFSIDAAAQLNNQASMMNASVLLKKEESGKIPDYKEVTPEEFSKQLSQLVDAYLLLKDALVNTDIETSSGQGEIFNTRLNEIDMNSLDDEAHLYWMKLYSNLKSHGEKLTGSEEIEQQRKQFDFLSQSLIESIKAFGVTTDSLYVQHCPMANKNNGADWVSAEKEIRNPYFGSKMLKCGLVKDTLIFN
ncbi:MAG: efflux RND transporter periplasmic adaptor subunit [Bacteroidia bacterium]|nr:efflux RND transporter periplasmic adaptor subunit [Bacteroidia bacterium]